MNPVEKYMKAQNMNTRTLSQLSNLPYSTVYELVHDGSKIERCQSRTVFAIARALNVSVDDLLRPVLSHRPDFELFKSQVCHTVKGETDLGFVQNTLSSNAIEEFYLREWFPECFYTLAMVDYLCRVNGLPQEKRYDYFRQQKLAAPIYPRDILLLVAITKDDSYLEKCVEESIPEFRRFNILECDIRSIA